MTDPTLVKLREFLLNEFTESELEQLSREVGLNYAALRGTGAFGKTRELVEAARTQDKLRLLQSKLRELRPDAFARANIQPAQSVQAPLTSAQPIPPPAAAIEATEPSEVQAGRPTSAPTPSATPRWLPILAIALVAVLCAAAVATLVLNRPVAPSTTVATSAPLANNAVTGDATPAGSATLAAVSGVTSTADLAAPATPITQVAGVVAGSTPELAVAVTTTVPAATDVPTAVPSPTVAPTAGPSPTPNANEAHPAALVIRELNQQLPEFYLGRATSTDLQSYWTGDAWRSVVNFGTTKLPRVMRLPPAQRSDLDVTYRYEQLPALQTTRGDTAVVAAREYWRYANAANAIEICEIRQYVYNLVTEGGKLKVREFTSRLLQSGCAP